MCEKARKDLRHYVVEGEVKSVEVLPRSQQWQCKHIWEDNVKAKERGGWKFICSRCGAKSRRKDYIYVFSRSRKEL